MTRFRPLHTIALILFLWIWVAPVWAQQQLADKKSEQDIAAKAVSLLSFVAVDYAESVADGTVRDRKLYHQQQNNVDVAAALLQRLPDKPGRAQLQDSLKELAQLIADRAGSDLVRRRANTAADRFAALYQLPRSPAESLPSGEEASALYRDRCIQCHGELGSALQPERRLDDPVRMANLSLYDFYNVLEPTRHDAHGADIDGDLTSRQRWALAVMVAGFSAPEIAPTPRLSEKYPALVGLPGMAVLRPAELPQEAQSALMWWRAHPTETRHLQHPLARAAGLLYLAQTAYRGGDIASAYHQLMLGFREGYLESRPQLIQRNPALTTQLDQQWQDLRVAILDLAPANEVIEKFQRLQSNVVRAREQLQPTSGGGIYGWGALLFIASLALGALLWYRLRRRHFPTA